jgi:hypothetical protein
VCQDNGGRWGTRKGGDEKGGRRGWGGDEIGREGEARAREREERERRDGGGGESAMERDRGEQKTPQSRRITGRQCRLGRGLVWAGPVPGANPLRGPGAARHRKLGLHASV